MNDKKYESAHQFYIYLCGYMIGLILIWLDYGDILLNISILITLMIGLAILVWLHPRMRTLFLKEEGIYTQMYYHDYPILLVAYDDIEKLIVYREYDDIKRVLLYTRSYTRLCIQNDYCDFQSFIDHLSVTLNIPTEDKETKV